jgi:hypothetical protein
MPVYLKVTQGWTSNKGGLVDGMSLQGDGSNSVVMDTRTIWTITTTLVDGQQHHLPLKIGSVDLALNQVDLTDIWIPQPTTFSISFSL